MNVIDVNSGNRTAAEDNQEQTAMDVNLAAAKEIARQLRLRDLGGIVIIDFIDLHKAQNRQRSSRRWSSSWLTIRPSIPSSLSPRSV